MQCVSTFDFSILHSTYIASLFIYENWQIIQIKFCREKFAFHMIRFTTGIYGANIEKVAAEQRVRTKKNTDTNDDKDVILVVSQIIR